MERMPEQMSEAETRYCSLLVSRGTSLYSRRGGVITPGKSGEGGCMGGC